MHTSDTVTAVVSFHEKLNRMQGIPIAGPFIVSPLKGLVSVAQIIVGLVGSILGLVGGYVFGALKMTDRAFFCMPMFIRSQEHLHIGLCQLANSIINGGTLGLFAHHIAATFGGGHEGPWRKVGIFVPSPYGFGGF